MATILVVDDDDMNLKMAEFILKKDMKENKVLLADSGMKAIDTLQREKVDLVLLDFQMPVMNGLKTLELIRKREDLKQGGDDGRSRLHQEAVHAERLD